MRDMHWRTWAVIGLLWTLAAGNLLHFVYNWTGKSVAAALFSAVNESTWEHMKLLAVPWILFSIVVGGDLFGLVGMVVGVPLFATFYGLAQEFVHYMLDKRGLDSEGNHVGEVVENEENVFE